MKKMTKREKISLGELETLFSDNKIVKNSFISDIDKYKFIAVTINGDYEFIDNISGVDTTNVSVFKTKNIRRRFMK